MSITPTHPRGADRRPHRSTSRRAAVTLLGLAALLVPLAACGSSDDDASPPTTVSDSRTIAHAFGETVVEGTPERIVTVGITDQDPVYALGEQPVAAQAWYAEQVAYPWAEEAIGGEITTEVIPSGDLNVEAVASHDPDLIIAVTAELTQEQYDQLSQLAPTIATAEGYDAATIPWQTQATMIGEALGKADEAAGLVADTEAAFSAAADRHPEWKGAEAVLASQYLGGQLLVYPADSPASVFLTDLGFTIAPGLDEFMDDSYGVPALSAERLDLIDVDLVLWDGYRELLAEAGLLDLPTFQNLAAVSEGRLVFPSPEVADALSFRNVLSLPWALERLEEPIAAAFDGDPATVVETES